MTAAFSNSSVVSVTVLDDFPLIRNALVDVLNCDPRLDVVGSCDTARSLFDALVVDEPAVALVDLNVPDMDGPELIGRLRRLHPSVRVVVCTACERAASVMSALHAGAHGYVVKRQEVSEIAEAIVSVHQGHMAIAPHVTAATLNCGDHDEAGGVHGVLSATELELLRRVVAGETDEVIARALYVSPRTVQNRLARLREAAGVARRTELVWWAMDNRLV